MTHIKDMQMMTLCIERNARKRDLHLGKGDPEKLKREIQEFQDEIDYRNANVPTKEDLQWG